MSTRGTRHVEMDQNLAHGSMMACKMMLGPGLTSTVTLASSHPPVKSS
jgi:hypothetical protein